MEKIHIRVEGGTVTDVYYDSAPTINLLDNDEVVLHDIDQVKAGEGFDCPRCGNTTVDENDHCTNCSQLLDEPL